jgi:hypothetical protein
VAVDGMDIKQAIEGDAALLFDCKRMRSGFQ